MALAGCFDVKPADGALGCSPSGACPSDYHCGTDQRCWRDGHDPDLGFDADLGSVGGCSDGQQGGTETDVDCGGSCSACNVGQSCAAAADCVTMICNAGTHKCVATQCEDGVKDGTETDVDCGGGTCAQCAVGGGCAAPTDCASGICNAATMKCVATICDDGIMDGSETDVDCGGSTCNKCLGGKSCLANTDCISGFCNSTTNKCVASQCEDGLKDGAETDIDCGGGTCMKCGATKACSSGGDCTSGYCGATSHTCVADQCHDMVKDGAETDVDCGGGTCGGCTVGRSCIANGDCASGSCSTSHVCVSSQCTDGMKDGAETDTDCGGGVCAPCSLGLGCTVSADCASGYCNATTHKCVADQCHDGVKNGSETDIDCGGGTCTACADGQHCAVGTRDCTSTWCNTSSGLCVASHCSDATKDGLETDVDCGGDCTTKCANNQGCGVDVDCTSTHCNMVIDKCVASACVDGRKDGAETDVDCGGGTCTTCALGQSCLSGATDCTSTWCNASSHVCVSSHCQDAQKDGTGAEAETDVDCGGSICGPCSVNQGCGGVADCTTGSCYMSHCVLQTGTPSWLPVHDMPNTRADTYGVSDTSGKVYCWMGTYTSNGNINPSGESYTPAPTSAWSGSLTYSPNPVYAYAAALGSDGMLYFGGGNVGSSPTDEKTVLAYDPTANAWRSPSPPAMAQGRRYLCATSALGRIFMMGGTQGTTAVGYVESWAPGDAAWTSKTALPTAISGCAAATAPDGHILVHPSPNGGAYIYNPSTDKWLGQSAAAATTHSSLVTAPDGRVYAVGGQTVEAYVASIDAWVPVASMGTPRVTTTAVGGDGRIYAMGGYVSTASAPLATVEAYGPIITPSSYGAARGGTFTVSGSNFAGSAQVKVYFDSTTSAPVASASSNGSGVVPSTTVTVPSGLTQGPHRLIVIDAKAQYPAYAQFNVN